MGSESIGARFRWERAFLAGPFDKTQRVVGLVLATHFNPNLSAYPSAKRLADLSGCTVKTVRKAIAHIEDAGYLLVDRRGPGAGAGNTNHYQGLIPADANGGQETHIDPVENGSRENHMPSENGSGQPPKRVWPAPETGALDPMNNNEQQEQQAAAASDRKALVAAARIRGNHSWPEHLEDRAKGEAGK